MLNIDEAIEETKRIVETNANFEFAKYAPIYLSPTGNVASVLDNYGDNDNILTVGAMGGLAYESILHHAKKIDLFDINVLQYLYFELVKEGIVHFDYQQFIDNFTTRIDEKGIFSIKSDLFKDIDELLKISDTPSNEYWRKLLELYSKKQLVNSELFNYLGTNIEYLKYKSSLYTKDSFNKIKRMIIDKNVSLNYIICNIEDIDNIFKDKYDLIMFDNILQFYSQLKKYKSVEEINTFIETKLSNMLTNSGKIEVCYGHQKTAIYMMDMFGDEDTSYIYHDSLYALSKKNIKAKGLIPNLYPLSDNYSIDFIPNSKRDYSNFSKHCLLTYTKSKKI